MNAYNKTLYRAILADFSQERKDFIDQLLSTGSVTDSIMAESIINIDMAQDAVDVTDILARRIYESLYIHRKPSQLSTRKVLKVSLLECSVFIGRILHAPTIQDFQKNCLKSVDNMLALLRTWLEEGCSYNGTELAHINNMFFNQTLFASYKELSPQWTFDTTKIDYMFSKVKYSYAFTVMASTVSMDDLLKMTEKGYTDTQRFRLNRKSLIQIMGVVDCATDNVFDNIILPTYNRLQIQNMMVKDNKIYFVGYTNDLRNADWLLYNISYIYRAILE